MDRQIQKTGKCKNKQFGFPVSIPMQEFNSVFYNTPVTVTPLEEAHHFMLTMNADDETHGIIIPELLGIMYPIEDAAMGYVWQPIAT
jgi:hypothetical protein